LIQAKTQQTPALSLNGNVQSTAPTKERAPKAAWSIIPSTTQCLKIDDFAESKQKEIDDFAVSHLLFAEKV
jgi:hypothetical protein